MKVLTAVWPGQAGTASGTAWWRTLAWAAGCVTLCHLPLLWVHVAQLLAKPHYQFMILLPAAAGLLLWQRIRDEEWSVPEPGRPMVAWSLGLLAVSVSLFAVWRWSPWVGWVGYLLNLLAVIYWLGGSKLLRLLGPAWVVLWLALPLPFELDENLIIRLRQVATAWTSDWLHLMGILHAVEGNVIQIPQKSFFVADACTGIHSFFVLMAAGFFLGLVRQRTILQLIALVACGLCLVMIENLVRVTAVVVVYNSYGWDWSEGFAHQTLGLVLFVLSLGLLLSADQLVAFLVPDFSFLWKWVTRWFGRLAKSGKQPSGEKPGTGSVGGTSPVFAKCMLAILVVIGGIGLVRFPWSSAASAAASTVGFGGARQELPEFGADLLPETLFGFERTGFRFERRSVAYPLSDRSQVWEYDSDQKRLGLSLDYTYSGVHNVLLCYQLTGWTMRSAEFVADPPHDGQGPSPVPFVEARMHKPFEGHGYVFFSYFNGSGEEGVRLYPIQELSVRERVVARLRSLVEPVKYEVVGHNIHLSGPAYQVQLLVVATDPLTDEQLEQMRQFFVTGREKLRTRTVEILNER
jgi:exosortase